MAHLKFKFETLNAFCNEAFEKFGFTSDESKTITDVLLLSDVYGIESHGMQRLSRYHKGIEKGMIKVDAKPEIVFETPVSAVIDGHAGMGQLISKFAMEKCIEKAKTVGMAIVTVRNSNHYGIAGYYAKMACDEGLMGMSFTNSEAIMVPTFARKAMLGSNPIALAMPAKPYPFFFDASTTVVTRGKLEMYRKAEKELPNGWALDKDGNPSIDAPDVLDNIANKIGGGIMPLDGMFCEIFCSILSQGLTSNHTHTNGIGGTCHGFIAIDPKIFGNPEDIETHFSTFLQELRDAPKAEGQPRIYTHGEKEVEATKDRMENGIDVDVKTVLEMKDLSNFVGVDFEKYFGKLDIEDNDYKTVY